MVDATALQSLVAAVVGIGAGYVGAFMVLRRMSLVGDALSHVALPGLAVALLLGVAPFFGAFAALLIAVIAVWAMERRSPNPPETLIGVLFTFALALGLLLTPEPELLEALFGSISAVSLADFIWATVAIVVVVAIMARTSRSLILSVVSRDLAEVSGARPERSSFLLLLAVALIVALGVRVTGTILTGALVIVPAATARNLCRSLYAYLVTSACLGGLAGGTGVLIARASGIAPGPAIILVAAVLFGLSLLRTR